MRDENFAIFTAKDGWGRNGVVQKLQTVLHTDFNFNFNFNFILIWKYNKKIYWDWPAVSELEGLRGRPQQAQAGNAKQNLRLNSDVNTETKKLGAAPHGRRTAKN